MGTCGTFDSVVDPDVCAGSLRKLKPSMTGELLTLMHHALMEFSLVPGQRDLEVQHTFPEGIRHLLPPPQLQVESARIVLVGDCTR